MKRIWKWRGWDNEERQAIGDSWIEGCSAVEARVCVRREEERVGVLAKEEED